METIAVYWEKKIKTYGFQISTELSLLDISLQGGQMDQLGCALEELKSDADRFYFVLSHLSERDVWRMLILVDRKTLDHILTQSEKSADCDPPPVIQTVTPVDVIHFQGPHFGDRYGVADVAFHTLADAAIPILAAGCAASSIYLVLPGGQGRKAAHALSETFDVAN